MRRRLHAHLYVVPGHKRRRRQWGNITGTLSSQTNCRPPSISSSLQHRSRPPPSWRAWSPITPAAVHSCFHLADLCGHAGLQRRSHQRFGQFDHDHPERLGLRLDSRTSSSASSLIEVDTTGNRWGGIDPRCQFLGLSVVLGATGEPANCFRCELDHRRSRTGQAINRRNSDVVDFGVNVGIGTTTPGSIFSVSGVGNWTGATTTYYATGGINLTGGGCFAINGSCISGAGGSNYWTASGGNIYNNTGTDVGIGTTTPGSLLSLNGIANFAAATSTFYSTGGINITHGCFSVAGTCITGGGTSYTFSYPLLNTSGTISQAWGTTTADIWSQLQTFTSGFISNASSTFTNTLNINGGTQNYGAVSTSTIPNNVPYAWTSCTSTTASPLLGITTTSGSEQVSSAYRIPTLSSVRQTGAPTSSSRTMRP